VPPGVYEIAKGRSGRSQASRSALREPGVEAASELIVGQDDAALRCDGHRYRHERLSRRLQRWRRMLPRRR